MSTTIEASAARLFSCFAQLDEEELALAEGHLEPVRLAPGEYLFRQDDAGHTLYLVASGAVEIRIRVPGQEDRVLSTLKPGSVFGELSMLLDRPRNAAAVAREASVVWQVSHAEFESALAAREGWAGRLLLDISESLARRLAAADEELVSLIGSASHREGVPPRAAELERLRERLFTEWSF